MKDKHPDIHRFAINENGHLGLIMEVEVVGKPVYLGIPVEDKANWISLKPRFVSGKVDIGCMVEIAMNLTKIDPSEDGPKPLIDHKILLLTPKSKDVTGAEDAKGFSPLDDLLRSFMGGAGAKPSDGKPMPSAEDFEIGDDSEEPDAK